ncbi:MAG: GGDEF domain-containing protein [Vulcanimicrobiaceae bacterium]|jgi:diguanylate cyclase (GGDEF)-like protein
MRSDPEPASARWFPIEFQDLLAVATAAIDEDGRLLEANAGFLRIIGVAGQPAAGFDAAQFFIQPRFSALAGAVVRSDGNVYSGLLTIGTFAGTTQTLSGHIRRLGSRLLVLVEYDVADLERLNKGVLEINQRYAEVQFALTEANFKLIQRERESRTASLTDALTGVANRRALDQSLVIEISRVARTNNKLSALMADIDHFKHVNDTYGHPIGDAVLEVFGDVLRTNTRATDVLARSGGEEFVVLMPETDLETAVGVAARICKAFAARCIEPVVGSTTASFGVAELGPGETGHALLVRVDTALYEAKCAGRNRVVADVFKTTTLATG